MATGSATGGSRIASAAPGLSYPDLSRGGPQRYPRQLSPSARPGPPDSASTYQPTRHVPPPPAPAPQPAPAAAPPGPRINTGMGSTISAAPSTRGPSQGVRAIRALNQVVSDRKSSAQEARNAAAQQRAQAYEAQHGRPLHLGGTRAPTQFAPNVQQRRLVSQAVDQAVPRPPRPDQAAPSAVPPTNGGAGHAAEGQLPNAPQRTPTANTGAGSTYTTGTGRTGNLPAGVAVNYREDGTPVFTNSPESAAAIAQQPAQSVPSEAVARMLASTPQMQSQPVQGPAAPRRLSRRATEPVAGEASRMASMRRNDLAWDMRRMGRGSPSTRRGLMDAYMQEQRLDADAVQGQANRDHQHDIAAMGHQAQAAEGAANRQLTASGQMLTAAQQAEQARQFNMSGQVLTAEDGTVSVLRNDGTLNALQAGDGQRFRTLTHQRGEITPQDHLRHLSEQRRAIVGGLMAPEQQESALAAVDDQIAALLGIGQAVPTQHIQMLREDPSTANEFDEQYGPGASGFFLGEAADQP